MGPASVEQVKAAIEHLRQLVGEFPGEEMPPGELATKAKAGKGALSHASAGKKALGKVPKSAPEPRPAVQNADLHDAANVVLTALGKIQSDNEARIRSTVHGRVLRILARSPEPENAIRPRLTLSQQRELRLLLREGPPVGSLIPDPAIQRLVNGARLKDVNLSGARIMAQTRIWRSKSSDTGAALSDVFNVLGEIGADLPPYTPRTIPGLPEPEAGMAAQISLV
jgi:hypothetical protein